MHARFFLHLSKVEVVVEHMMDAVVAVSGSSPAYVFMFIEAMADAAVAEGDAESTGIQICSTRQGSWKCEDGS